MIISATNLDLSVQTFRFICKAQTFITFGANAGAQLRGGMWQGLRDIVGTSGGEYHPLTRLMTLEANTDRGQNPARPFVIHPPLAPRAEYDRRYATGETFVFGITLIGDATDFFPYIVQAIHRIGKEGVGHGRGQFCLQHIHQIDINGNVEELLEHSGNVRLPKGLITTSDVLERTAKLPSDKLRLRFLTPTQIVRQKRKFASTPDFSSLVARLIDRVQSLYEMYHTEIELPFITKPMWKETYLALAELARDVHVVQDNTRWVKVRSGSRRTGESTPIGGFVGEVLFEGNLEPFLEWIVWGELLHIGKNTVKGNGWYEITTP